MTPVERPMKQTKASPQDCVDRLKVLADATRLSVIKMLMAGPRHVRDLNAELKIDQSLLSHHLRILREADLVSTVRDGKAVLYGLVPGVGVEGMEESINLGCCHLSFTERGSKKI